MKHVKIKSSARKLVNEDIPYIVEVELERYAELYSEKPKTKKDIASLFAQRKLIAGEWMWVSLLKGKPVGFLSAMPTHKAPVDFVSWEETTNHGSLIDRFDESGRNVYVVNLDVSRSATKLNGQYVLMAQLASKVIREDKDIVFFESRMPMFREWVHQHIGQTKWQKMSRAKQLEVARQYAELRVDKNGKQVLYDRLLRFYEESGFIIDRIVPNAFQDNESLHFGAVCVTKNPLPKILRILPARIVISAILARLGNSPQLLEKFVG